MCWAVSCALPVPDCLLRNSCGRIEVRPRSEDRRMPRLTTLAEILPVRLRSARAGKFCFHTSLSGCYWNGICRADQSSTPIRPGIRRELFRARRNKSAWNPFTFVCIQIWFQTPGVFIDLCARKTGVHHWSAQWNVIMYAAPLFGRMMPFCPAMTSFPSEERMLNTACSCGGISRKP